LLSFTYNDLLVLVHLSNAWILRKKQYLVDCTGFFTWWTFADNWCYCGLEKKWLSV